MATQNPFDQFDTETNNPVPVSSIQPIVAAPRPVEKPEKPTETFSIATPEQKAAAGLDPNRVYQVNAVTGEFKDVGGQPTPKLAAENPNRAFQINSALDALKNVRKLANQSLSVGETAGRVRQTPVIGAVLGQNRADLEGALSLVSSNLIQDQMAYLAQLNPQGMSSLANTETEAARLAASIANLDPNQSLDQFLTGVQRAEDYYNRQLSEMGATRPGENGAPVAGLTTALPGDRVVAEKDLKNAQDLQAAWRSGKTIEELNAISMANVGSPLTAESIAALTADTNRQLQFTPYIAPMEDVTEDMGVVEGLVESVTGSERSTPEVEAAADWTTMPELNELSIAGAKTGIGTLFTSPEESVKIIQANYPGVEVRQDSKGNYILRSQDGKDYGIKPGFRFSDVPRAAAGIFAFTPAGRAATFTGAALKSGATQAAIEGTEFAAGGEFNAQPIALATTFGAGGKVVEDIASAALPRIVSQVRQMRGQPEVPLGAAPEAPAGIGMPSATTMAPEAPVAGATASPAPTIATPAPGVAPTSRPAGGAMSTSEQTIRAQRAAELPVPIELARFLRTRDFVEQQRARELAKNNEVGGPIRDRMAQQQDELRQNFERFIEGTGSEVWNNPYEQGGVIADALGTLAKRERTRTNALYKRAEKSGEMREPVDYKELSDFIAGQTPTTREKLAPVLKTVEEQLLANDPNKTGMISLNMMEDIRKLINKVASPGTPDASFGRDMRSIIDNATKDAGGDVYKQARASRAKYARDFEDIDLVQKVFATKPGSTERYVGLEKVVDKITGEGTSLDSVKHLFGLLEKAGPRGTRAMRELQGSVMEKIRDQAYRGVTTDQSGQTVIQPAALNKIITSLNKNGKLDLIFDKKTAELLNTINDVTKDIITAPPGSVNASGTSSAMMNALDTLGTYGTTGLPIPAAKILNGFRQSMANRGMRKEVKRLLD